MLISVMRDNVTCEEVFELNVDVCDEWLNEPVVEEEEEEVCWCKFFESCPSCFGKK